MNLREIVSSNDLTRHLAIRIGSLAILVGILWFLRPLFHPLIYRIVYSPTLLIIGGGAILVATLLFLAPPLPTSSDQNLMASPSAKLTLFGMAFVILLVLGVLYGIPASEVEERTLAQDTMADSQILEEFPEMNEQNARITPGAVADTQTRGSVSYRQHQLGESDIARMEDGRLAWSYAIEPDPFQVQLSGNQRGVLLSDMTRMENREMQAYDENDFTYGQNMLLHRSADWNLKKSGYWDQYNDDPIEFVHDGEAYMAYPKTGHEWRFSPIPHTVPVWDGVALVHQDGTIEHLSPEEAQQNEALDGQRLYPLDITEQKMNSLGYRNGITNQMGLIGSYEGVIEPASLPSGAGNDQPFVIDLAGEQMSYVMAMEPHGDSTTGLDEVWFTDATTGEVTYYETGSETLRGPDRAMGVARGTDTQTSWGEDGDALIVEPVPVSVDGELWWHSKVVTTDQTDVVRNIFVNAHTDEAVILFETEEVYDFIAGTDVAELDSAEAIDEEGEEIETEPEPDDPEVAYYIVIYDAAGDEIDRIEIEPGQDVSFESEQRADDEP
ncbi:hypothetical protein C482_16003 [Natrialba chahannaoensis JCM 10990]|uniref:Uncharacterized protein n=1 Tax=Natrialba chahannaoensis JCM 10990 TaxID=1227492 RepID=M0ABN8_9EURY|nr:hypothetical protein [Natrialba chahannaoensis]ELY96160.1 hypothetical protein C482_16003 [Natrialba chahannaoensis JCM 10990]